MVVLQMLSQVHDPEGLCLRGVTRFRLSQPAARVRMRWKWNR